MLHGDLNIKYDVTRGDACHSPFNVFISKSFAKRIEHIAMRVEFSKKNFRPFFISHCWLISFQYLLFYKMWDGDEDFNHFITYLK